MRAFGRAGLFGLAALLALGSAALRADDKKAPKPTPTPEQPFFHQFLVYGDPMDDRLLAQEKKVEQDPNSASLRNDYGNLLALRRFPKEARAEYKKALKLDPKYFIAAYNLGMLEETEGNVAAAMSAYKQAIDIRRGFPPAHFRLGLLYEAQSRDEDAVAEYAKAIWIDPYMRDPHFNPLVVETRLMDQASLANYSRDIARSSMKNSAEWVEPPPKLKPVAVDHPLDADEVATEEAGPQTIETSKSAPAAPGSRSPGAARSNAPPRQVVRPGRPGARPAEAAPPPVPTPVPAEAPPPPEPEPEPQR